MSGSGCVHFYMREEDFNYHLEDLYTSLKNVSLTVKIIKINCYLLFDPHLMNKVEFSKTLHYFPVKSLCTIKCIASFVNAP